MPMGQVLRQAHALHHRLQVCPEIITVTDVTEMVDKRGFDPASSGAPLPIILMLEV